MKTFWSGTDETCIQNLANSNYLIPVVTNKNGDILARVDIFKPFHVTLNDLKVEVYYPEDPRLSEFCKVEFATKGIYYCFVVPCCRIWIVRFSGWI